MTNKQSLLLLAFCLLGFILRVAYCLLTGDELRFPDEKRFWEEASNIIDSGTLLWKDEYAHDMPLTALSIALIVNIGDVGILGVKLVYACISTLTIYVIAKLAGLFSDRPLVPICAAAIAAVYPFFIFYSALLLSETLFLFLLTTYFYFLLRASRNDHLLSGVIGGCAHLVRPSLYYFYPAVCLIQRFLLGYSWKAAVTTLVLTVVIIIPWGLRNYTVFDIFILGTTGVGQVLWEGNNPYNPDGRTSGEFLKYGNYLQDMPDGLDELERDSWKKQRALDFIKDNPGRFLQVSAKRFVRFWSLWPNHPQFRKPLYVALSLMSYGLVLVGALFSVWVLRERWRYTLSLVLFMGYYTLIHVISIGSIRYRLPLEPIMISMAVAGFVELFEKMRLSGPSKDKIRWS